MRIREGVSFRKTCVWIALSACFLLAGYLSFISVLSVFIGVKSAPQPGFWVPILAGLTCVLLVFWILVRFTKVVLSQMAEQGIVGI